MEVGLQSGLQGQQEFYQGSSSLSGMPCIKVANKISRRESVHLLHLTHNYCSISTWIEVTIYIRV